MTTSTPETPVAANELAEAVVEVLTRKGPALTVAQVREQLPRRCRLPNADIGRCLDELVAQGKAHAWPAYRSKSARYGAQPMEAYAREALTRLLGETAFTPAELLAALREEAPGLPEDQGKRLIDEVLVGGQVRKLPPRLGSNIHLLGTPHPRAYLAPLFETMLKGLDKLYLRLESEGVPRTRVLEEAKDLWHEVVREAEKDLEIGAAPPAEEQRVAQPEPAPAAHAPDLPPVAVAPTPEASRAPELPATATGTEPPAGEPSQPPL